MSRVHRLTALAAALVVATAACDDANAPIEPSASASTPMLKSSSTTTSSVTTWLSEFARCGAQTYYKTVQKVGVSVGMLVAGKHGLLIPAGALSTRVTITMESMPDSIVNVRLSPDGLKFNAAAQPTLTLNLYGCPVPSGTTPRIAYVNDSFTVISVLPTTWDATRYVVSGKLEHFSRYAVHY